MKHDDLHRQNGMLKHLSTLPKKMLVLHRADHVAHCVLHDLCNEQCFDLHKAEYFVDNPDFDGIRGVAGFSRQDAVIDYASLWNNPDAFKQHLQDSPFNQQVRTIERMSSHKKNLQSSEIAHALAQDLGFNQYSFCIWPMKHDNHGIVLYEKANVADTSVDDYMEHG